MWAEHNYRHTNNKLIINEQSIRALQDKLWLQPYSRIIIDHINKLIRQRENLLLFHQRCWTKESWKTWLTPGDRSSRFFHNKMKAQIASTSICKLKTDLDL